MRIRKFGLRAGVAAALSLATGSTDAVAAASEPGTARPVGPCGAGQICRFEDPEDLADLTGTPWLIVSQGTGLAAFDTATDAVRPLEIDEAVPCLPGAHGGGIGLRREGKAYRLVRILHGTDGDAVETLRVTVRHGTPQATRTGCAIAPAYFLNDIAPLPDGGFAATHMFDRAMPRADRETAFLSGAMTGFVVRWSPGSGWQRLPGTDGTFPNGLDVSPDGRWIAFAEIYGHALNRVRIDGSGRSRVPLAMNPDNVTALGGARFLVVGGTGAPITSTRRCPELRRPGCGFPAMAAEVDFTTGSMTPLVVSDGASTPGFSVGVRKRGRIYLGTAFGDRVTVVTPGKLPARLP